MSGSERGGCHNVHASRAGILGGFFRCLEKGADLDLPTKVHQCGSDDFLAPIMPVLSHFRDIDFRAATMFGFECFGEAHGFLGTIRGLYAGPIDPFDRPDHRLVSSLAALNRFRDYADRGLGPRGIHRQGQEITFCARCGGCDRVQLGINLGLAAI